MAKIWKRQDRDCWVADFRDATGRRVRLMAKTRQEAEDKLAVAIQESRRPMTELEDRDITLNEYAKRWLAKSITELETRTIRSYEQLFTLHILPALGSLPLREIRRRNIRQLVNDCRTKGLGRNTVRLVRAALSSLLTDAVEDELLSANPALGLFRKARRANAQPLPDVNPFTHVQAAAFNVALNTMHDEGCLDIRYVMLFRMMHRTGIRPSEAFALQPGDVDFIGRGLHVERALDGSGRVKETKTHEKRVVDVPKSMIDQLREYVTWLEAEACAAGLPSHPALFPADGWGTLNERHVRNLFKRVLRKAGLPARFKLYDLRHTYGSTLLSASVPLLYVSRQMGHAKPTTTLKYYAKWIPNGDKGYADVIDEVEQAVLEKVGTNLGTNGLANPILQEPELTEVAENKDGGPCRGRTYGPLIKRSSPGIAEANVKLVIPASVQGIRYLAFCS